MPVMMQRGHIETACMQQQGPCQIPWNVTYDASAPGLTIGLINNMPDAALESTEIQFSRLIGSAAGDIPVRLQLYSLPNLPRSESAQQHLNQFYFKIDELWMSPCDALIITGTEPRQADLREEAYWTVLTEVFDWAQSNALSTVVSCLAAHAAVLHNDGIKRHRLSDKRRIRIQESPRPRTHAQKRGDRANSPFAVERTAGGRSRFLWLHCPR